MSVRFCIDRGGTFTDIYAEIDGGPHTVLKLLSVDPDNYDDAPREGIRRILEHFFNEPHPRDRPLDTSRIHSIRMGTTVATNALLERQGAEMALVVTKGFKDVLYIGNQSRPKIFDLSIATQDQLYKDVVEIEERVIIDRDNVGEVCSTGERVLVEKCVPVEDTRAKLEFIYKKGVRSIAVVLMHGALYPEHEKVVGRIARQVGFTQVSLSHQVMRMVKFVGRGFTSCADAYLTPHIVEYVSKFVAGFDENLLRRVQVSFMQSDGGLTSVNRFSGHKAILSGPAGGVVGYAVTTRLAQTESTQYVGFDMGGTSTDVSRYAGHYDHVFETTTAGVTIQAPQLDIHTIAAGGGSKLTFENGLFHVGPQSVGAHPGPVCYRKGGELAVTDANVMLGRLVPDYFPHIFGESESEPLDARATTRAFERLTARVNRETGDVKTPVDVAFGFIKIANEAMCRPIRNLTQMRGFDISKHVLACFGGAGGQHACAIARALGMKTVFIHRFSGILSAFGIGLADVVEDEQEPCALRASELNDQLHDSIRKRLEDKLVKQGFDRASLTCELFLNMRYEGTDTALMVRGGDFLKEFFACYEREFGFLLHDRDVLVDDVRVRVSGVSGARRALELERSRVSRTAEKIIPIEQRKVYFDGGWTDTPFFRLADLSDSSVSGPAILLDPNSTIVVEPHCVAHVSVSGDVTVDILERHENQTSQDYFSVVDPIHLSLFSHRFMGIAEQMGRTLQRTSVSVNIKERLDFSCALFGPDGGLVANAPHIPVHLGAMQEAIKFQKRHCGNELVEGDVLVSNHPQLAGGSHLPDITVITPCFLNGEIVFWVASRGHHADVGGITPGSMPPASKRLLDEGAAIISFKLVRAGEFQTEGISNILQTPSNPDDPACTGTRCLADNLSDLRAQVAANNHGVHLVGSLIEEFNLDMVHAYMSHIQVNAENSVRQMLIEFCRTHKRSTASAVDHLDNGTRIQVKVDICPDTGSATFDFEGTGPQVYGNLNAPPAITYSALIYCLRALVNKDIPLNQGCLAPVTIKIPQNSILNPSPDVAVVGGNVLTSQRIVDVILKAFEACAASQGCMNNLTFGDDTFGYYETIAGGAGAGPSWQGRSGVHTHMTNTRITDPEIFEKRYPVVLREFSLRKQSGGDGLFKGGDGIIREIEFLRTVTLSILSERRAFKPYGMHGGKPGKTGQNILISNKIHHDLGSKNTVTAKPGDRIIIKTPGAGGYGTPQHPKL
mmetsp:Transcript_1761/g.2874  ORF Transcript_1761/g.2874 Transcript_1761/m.2874 type:complete len:1237 (-) Transcript_1761:767-4477(-)